MLTEVRERVIMYYDAGKGHNVGSCRVVFSTTDIALSAIKGLQSAPLFDRKVDLFGPERAPLHTDSIPEIKWGWVASSSPDIERVCLRKPWLRPPDDVRVSIIMYHHTR